jgi:hypothetical protein
VPYLDGPLTPVAGVALQSQNPLLGSGNVTTIGADIRNISPFLLEVTNGSGTNIGLIDPFTRDWVPMDPTAGQLLTITPVDVGFVAPGTVVVSVYIMYYQAGETPPTNLPIPLGATQVVAYNSSGGP